MIASYAAFGVEYATIVTSPGVVTNGDAEEAGALPGAVLGALGAADVGLAAADVAALGALVDAEAAGAVVVLAADGFVVAALPPHAVTKTAVAARSAARRRNERLVVNTSAFPV